MGDVERERRKKYKVARKARDPEGWRAMRKEQKKRYRDKRRIPGRLGRGELASMPPDDKRAYDRQKRLQYDYGLPAGRYEEMLASQGGVCAVCGGTEEGKVLVVDHCHATERVRGLLCNQCNFGLGAFRDTPSFLEGAIRYLAIFSGTDSQGVTDGQG